MTSSIIITLAIIVAPSLAITVSLSLSLSNAHTIPRHLTKFILLEDESRLSRCDSDSLSPGPTVEPDHPERHDLWEPVVIARDSALAENICVGVSDCARPEIWPNIFICG